MSWEYAGVYSEAPGNHHLHSYDDGMLSCQVRYKRVPLAAADVTSPAAVLTLWQLIFASSRR
jgi:hypothetical protein